MMPCCRDMTAKPVDFAPKWVDSEAKSDDFEAKWPDFDLPRTGAALA